jgi:choline dehydrogenase
MMEADYVVVGAGSAGCVVASRLSEDGARVVVLEAGGSDRHPIIQVPAAVIKLMHHPRFNWNYVAEPEPGTAHRSIPWPRGKVLGGSGSINGMNFVRGNPADFDGWAQLGCRGWSYDDVLPHFKAIERRQGGDGKFRGEAGPIPVENYRTVLPIVRTFVEAAVQAGFRFTPDINGESQEGVGYSQMNRTRVRQSTARTFLRPAAKRSHVRILTHAHATRLLFEGRRCVGVAFHSNGAETEVRAKREVILSGGSINSPQLLQISGIGPAAHLQEIGVPTLHDLKGVGAGLIDHYQARVSYRIAGMESVNEYSRGVKLAWEIAKWATVGSGALTFGITQVSVFARSREGLASPDLQLLFVPGSFERMGVMDREPGVSLTVCPGRPDSRGSIMARSPDPFASPVIRPNYLSAASDRQTLVAGLRIARQIFQQPAIAPYCVAEIAPGSERISDEALLQYARETGGSVYHPVGTCRMGEDEEAVVDSRLRVRGLEGLRVIDASVMPTLTTGNTQAPTIMIAEKGAAMLREDWRAAQAASLSRADGRQQDGPARSGGGPGLRPGSVHRLRGSADERRNRSGD